MAQIRRAKLRCTCHGAIFERVLVRRTQEYKSIPRTTSRKSPEIAHVRRHGSLSCMPLFSPRKPRFHRRVRGSQGVAVAAHVRRRDGNLYSDGGKREGERRERESVVTRHKSYRCASPRGEQRRIHIIKIRLFPDMRREKTPREPRTRRQKGGKRGKTRGRTQRAGERCHPS